MNQSRAILAGAVFLSIALIIPAAQDSKGTVPNAVPTTPQPKVGREYSGMYSFLKDGEFLQITVEDEGRVTGFVSRYNDEGSDKDEFVDQYFSAGKLDGSNLTFTTKPVHAKWFDFKGAVERGEGKNPEDESYYVLRGTLAESTNDPQKKTASHTLEVVFRKFPADASPAKN